jgi:hypothetical protein
MEKYETAVEMSTRRPRIWKIRMVLGNYSVNVVV